jgi:hypothetical protein
MKHKYYKYRPLYQPDKQVDPFTQSIFKAAEVYFSEPCSFNDPFDCNLKLHNNDSSDEEWEAYFRYIIQKTPSMIDNIEDLISRKRWREELILSTGTTDPTCRKIYKESSVFCLSRKGNSIPMFSHYADDHKGIAIEFEFSDLEVPAGIEYLKAGKVITQDNCVVFDDVIYSESFPELNSHRLINSEEIVTNLIFTKHIDWKYEKEFRIFRLGVPASPVKYEKALLTRIVFGCRTTASDVELVKSWIADWPTNVALSKATMSSFEFELNINDF